MTTNLLKRLESSIESFRLTLKSLRANHMNTLAKISTFNETSDLSGIDSRINDLTDQLENLDADDDLPCIGDSGSVARSKSASQIWTCLLGSTT